MVSFAPHTSHRCPAVGPNSVWTLEDCLRQTLYRVDGYLMHANALTQYEVAELYGEAYKQIADY